MTNSYQNTSEVHKPVLVNEILGFLNCNDHAHTNTHARYIDATLGAAGHSIPLLKTGAVVLGIDDDDLMLDIARAHVKSEFPDMDYGGGEFLAVRGNFKDLDSIAVNSGFKNVDGIIFDLGLSSYHFDNDKRGFSFADGQQILDMRLNTTDQKITASDLLNTLSTAQLTEMFSKVMERSESRKLARMISKCRIAKQFKCVDDLLAVIRKSGLFRRKRDIATLPFLALRIAVNTEFENLKLGLSKAMKLLKSGGVLLVISFHSGEDRIVKETFNTFEKNSTATIKTKSPVTPSRVEISNNPRSRSAKLRVAQKY